MVDFEFGEEEQAIGELCAQIMGDLVTHERLRSMASTGERLDRACWRALADAGIVGATLPEDQGGAGLGFLAATVLAEEVGRRSALVPVLETVVAAALPLSQFATAGQRAEYLPAIASGELIATAALVPGPPVTVSDGCLNGTVDFVPAGLDADLVLVPAGDGVYLVPTAAAGIRRRARPTTTGQPQALIELSDVAAERLGTAQGDEVMAFARLRLDSAICSVMAGTCQAALELTAEYAKSREQFGRAIATFQAVSQRAGDAYIDTEGVVLTSRQAAWRIAAQLPAEEQVAIARWWAAEAGFRVVHAATHLHGGVGVDRNYPLHRCFLLARQLELFLGNSEEQLARLGDLIAARA